MKRTLSVIPVSELLRRRNRINLHPEYQTGIRWRSPKQALLIDSVLKGFPVPKFVFHDNRDKDTLDAIDGQQRLTSIFNFADGNLHLPDGRTIDDLTNEERLTFDKFDLDVEDWDGSESEVIASFVRLQNGSPLSHQEKRDAEVNNPKRNFVHSLIQHPFIQRLPLRGHTKRAEAVTAIVFVAEQGLSYRCTNTNMNDFWRSGTFDPNGENARLLCHSLDFLGSAIGEHTECLNGAAWVRDIVYLVITLMREGVDIQKIQKRFRLDFVLPFYESFRAAMEARSTRKPKYSPHIVPDSDAKEFAGAILDFAIDSEHTRRRAVILRNRYFDVFPECKTTKERVSR